MGEGMRVKPVYVLVSKRTKNKFLSGSLKGYMRTIDPETLEYEAEEGVLNCYGTMDQAMNIRDRLDSEKQVSLLAFFIPANCVVPRPINRGRHSKRYVADRVEERLGRRNYLGCYGEGDERYLILADMACLLEVCDPEEEEGSVQPVEPAVKEKKPEQTVKAVMQETFKDVLPQTDNEEGTPAWVMPSMGGMFFGFLLGIAFSRCVREYPLATATVLPVFVAVLVIAWLYGYGNRIK